VTSNICRVCGARSEQRACPQCGASTVASQLSACLAGVTAGQAAPGTSPGSGIAPKDLARPRSLTIHLRILLLVPLVPCALALALLTNQDKGVPVRVIAALIVTVSLGWIGAAVLWPLFRGFAWARITYICLYWMGAVFAALYLLGVRTPAAAGGLCAQVVLAGYATWILARPEAVMWYARHQRA